MNDNKNLIPMRRRISRQAGVRFCFVPAAGSLFEYVGKGKIDERDKTDPEQDPGRALKTDYIGTFMDVWICTPVLADDWRLYPFGSVRFCAEFGDFAGQP